MSSNGATRDFPIRLFYSEEDGGFIADVPALPVCSAFGETPEEALAEVERAKAAWLAVAEEEGRPVRGSGYRDASRRCATRTTSTVSSPS